MSISKTIKILVYCAYLLLATLYIAPVLQDYQIWLKPLPIVLLIVYIQIVRNGQNSMIFIQAGLIFGTIGDVFLDIKQSQICLYFGVMAFGIGHVFYILGFRLMRRNNKLQGTKPVFSTAIAWILYSAIILIQTVLTIYLLWKYLQGFKLVGLIAYLSILSLMNIVSNAVLYKDNMLVDRMLVLIGTLLFYISDIILVQKIFNQELGKDIKHLCGYLVGITYWMGQFLIGTCCLKICTHFKDVKTKVYSQEDSIVY